MYELTIVHEKDSQIKLSKGQPFVCELNLQKKLSCRQTIVRNMDLQMKLLHVKTNYRTRKEFTNETIVKATFRI